MIFVRNISNGRIEKVSEEAAAVLCKSGHERVTGKTEIAFLEAETAERAAETAPAAPPPAPPTPQGAHTNVSNSQTHVTNLQSGSSQGSSLESGPGENA